MKYIEKDFQSQTVIDYEVELKNNQLDEHSLSNPAVHETMKGPSVYDQVKSFMNFSDLKKQLFKDQGGICCYCGRRLEYPNHPPYIVEHVVPKESDRTLAGEYKNLLLSCRPSEEEEKLRKEVSKKAGRSFFHCDKSKEATPITYSPLDRLCESIFKYDEFGNVFVGINDSDANKDLETLNLNCTYLINRRKAAIEGELFDENNELLPDEALRSRLDSIMKRNEDDSFVEFCFAIKGAIEHILQ